MKAVVIGAGITGLAVTARLRDLGWEVVLVEKAPGPRPQGYMIDFFGPGYTAARETGLEPRLWELAGQVDEVAYFDRDGERRAGLGYAAFQQGIDGDLLSIMRPDLELALRETLDEQPRYGVGIAGIDNRPDGVTATLTDGSRVEADLLVGADGVHSRTRALVFGPPEGFLRPLGLHTAAWIFDDPKVRETVGQRFALTDSVDRMMGLYGLRDGRVAVFSVHRETSTELPGDPRPILRETYGDLGWVVPNALAGLPEPAGIYYDLVAQVEMGTWHRDRVVLLGDAAYAVSLLAGQGASLGIAGAYVLAGLLRTEPIGEALTAFERRWMPVTSERQRKGRQGIDWFLPHSRGRLFARRMAMRAMVVPGVNRLFSTALVGKSHEPVLSAGG
ncbi:FAD-dependent monooxygenase [Phytomonospora endophytica]|uniref:2-polyprenyl-6-methoxyphenol hydroxylase-like FAD-dependent oxidoreductase n=1 Tax=Phytomonospora endophytica TaxID=714109 RepID=A0A841FYT6_9ACTN|nr:FAD-dependent monooxygenase [Phytomonospora endophytica]MBB6039903.1 2-polyprenyl-6-methoxyphenol hydroxylase-like FAD-dependent oxidoreductase [Phytomonospora endophytica]GIG71027.1 FAD-dependent oxidoreductase [Phytomonospora endophytica]